MTLANSKLVSKIQTFSSLIGQIEFFSAQKNPLIVAVDGRSASGKSTFGQHLAKFLHAPIVHTDDVAWHHSFFDWYPLLIEHILKPFKAGQAVNWTPESWQTRGREGAIVAPIAPMLIVEGVSASRLELQNWIDYSIWLETDLDVAEKRGLIRDGPEAHDFWFEWQAAERPFLEIDRPWERADLMVDGAPTLEHDQETQFVMLKPSRKTT